MQATFTPSVRVSGSTIPDFRSFEVTHRVGAAEKSFSVELERPTELSTEDTINISFSIGGASFPLITNKRVEMTSNSTMQTTLRGAGSLVTRYGSDQTLVFVNQTWLKSIFPAYYFRDGLLYKANPGTNPVRWKGVSAQRLMLPNLPGKNMRDCEFQCILQPEISYYDIAQYIGEKIGYSVRTDCPTLYVQKTFYLNAGETYFQALARLYNIFDPLIHVEGDTIYISDKGGSAQTPGVGTSVVSMTEDSFSVLGYNVSDTDQIVDHVLILGASSQWTYVEESALSTTRTRRTEVELQGEEQTLVYEFNYSTESSEYLSLLQAELSAGGIDLTNEEVFEYLNRSADKNGRQVRTVTMVTDDNSGESATKSEVIATYNVSDVLVHQVTTTNKWADFHTPLGHTVIEKARLGVVQGGTTESQSGGYKITVPATYEFIPIMAKYVRFGDYIGETGQVDADIDEYHAVTWYKDMDTVDSVEVPIRSTPQIVTRNSLIGTTPYTWEESDDPETAGWEKGFFLTRRERVRYDSLSLYLLRKNRFVEEFLPVYHNKHYTEDIPLKRRKVNRDVVQAKWEFFKVNNSIIEWNGQGTRPTPVAGPGTLPGQAPSFHPVFTLSCPDLKDQTIAKHIAECIFSKRISSNTTATIKTVIPIPGIKPGDMINLPSCSKRVFLWSSSGAGGAWGTVTIDSQRLWITAVTTKCLFSGSVESTARTADIYQEIELRQNY